MLLFMVISIPAPRQSAPMGGFSFRIFSRTDETLGNLSMMAFAMRPPTCSNSLDGTDISLFIVSKMSA